MMTEEERKHNAKLICRRTLSSDAYLTVNKYLIRKLGLKEAILLADLISKDEYFGSRGKLDEEGFFFNTREDRKKSTCLSYDLQYKIVKSLTELGLLETKRKGIPAKTYFKIDYEILTNILSEPRKEEKETTKINVIAKSKDFTYSVQSKKHTLINNNKSNNNKASLKNPKEANNALQGRASRGSRRDIHNEETYDQHKEAANNNEPITVPTPKPTKKGSLLSKGSHEPIKVKTSSYVEHWNTLDNVTHHQYFNSKDKPSITYSTAHKLCVQLNRGIFHKNTVNKTFLLKHKIDKSLLARKFTRKEINSTLCNLSMMFAPGHWAGNGHKLSPNLSSLLYSPINQSSMFLAMHANPDMADLTLEYKKPKDRHPGLTRRVAPLLDKRPKGNKQLYLLYKGIESIANYHKTIKVNRGNIGTSLDRWFDYYIYFLEDGCNDIEVRPDMIKAQGWMWDRFLREYEEEWYVDPREGQY